ncbi:hypothetical protein SAMN06296386_101120 [Lachnospiraceae bacterium]|nr:hypothetical protein SAMN06296386_101120 [Lachnospiraceae bacterium]
MTREFFEKELFPLLKADGVLTEEETDAMNSFSEKMLDDVALGHHKWYDNSGGYPEEFDTSKSPLKTLIDLVMCCDCLDAATDTVGRSYSRGKTLEEFLEEVQEGSGTRYAPWIVNLLERREVRVDINFLLQKGRENNYQDTYLLLRNMQDNI